MFEINLLKKPSIHKHNSHPVVSSDNKCKDKGLNDRLSNPKPKLKFISIFICLLIVSAIISLFIYYMGKGEYISSLIRGILFNK